MFIPKDYQENYEENQAVRRQTHNRQDTHPSSPVLPYVPHIPQVQNVPQIQYFSQAQQLPNRSDTSRSIKNIYIGPEGSYPTLRDMETDYTRKL